MAGARQDSAQALNSTAAKGWNLGAGGLLVFITLLAYLPAINGGFLWDDNGHVTRADLRSLEGLRRIWFEVGATQQYYPLLHSAFWVEHRVWGDAVLGYHLMNILLHATAACLVVAIMRRLKLPGAWFAGFIFALHPVEVESVAWISEQKNTLSAVFGLGAALVYLGFDRDRRIAKYWLAFGLFVLALLTKTVTATLPPALLVIFWWQRGRLEWKRDVRPLVPWFGLGATAGLFSAWVERTFIGAHGADFALSMLERSLLAGRVICFYLAKLLWPADLMFIYPRWEVEAASWPQYLFPLGVLALVVTLGLVARRHRGPLAGFLIFVGMLFPALGFINVYPFKYSYVADHFQYLAGLGLIVPLAAGLTLLAGRLPDAAQRLAVWGAGGLMAVLAALTWQQSGIYRDVETLYRATLARNPTCSMAHNNLGEYLLNLPGRLPEAMEQYEAALRANPRNAEAHNNLGYALAKIPGRLSEAIEHYETALRLIPEFWEAHTNLGNALAKIPGRLAEAITHYQVAVRFNPRAAEMYDNLGVALLKQPGRAAEAVTRLEWAVRLNPLAAGMHNNLGTALAQIPGRLPQATAEFEAAVRLNPGSTEMHNNLGAALAQIPERMPDAIAQFEAALRLVPDAAEAHNNLGAALMKMPGRLPEAVAHFEAATRIKPDFAAAHNNLGNALAQLPGRLPEAVEHLEAAARLEPDSADMQQQLGAALLKIPGRTSEAIGHFETAVRINPDYMEAHYVLGLLLSGLPGRQPEALAHFEAVSRLKPDFAPAREWAERLRANRP